MNNSENEDRTLEIAEVPWHTLKPHLVRDAIIVVSADLDLRLVATEIAEDNTAAIQAKIESGTIGKPSTEQVNCWEEDPVKEFACAIVQPFVLIQERQCA